MRGHVLRVRNLRWNQRVPIKIATLRFPSGLAFLPGLAARKRSTQRGPVLAILSPIQDQTALEEPAKVAREVARTVILGGAL